MLKINFERPLSALEIRDPAMAVCRDVASRFDLYAIFQQPQQPALAGSPYDRDRQRIGNGKHKNWYVEFQSDPPQKSRPRVVGRIALKAPYNPDAMEYGGFVYGRYGETAPKYNFVSVHTPTELGFAFLPNDPEPDILAMVYHELEELFVAPYPRFFDINDYDTLAIAPPITELGAVQ